MTLDQIEIELARLPPTKQTDRIITLLLELVAETRRRFYALESTKR